MSFPADVADDADLFDWTEVVTVRSIDPDDGSTLVTCGGVAALRRAGKGGTKQLPEQGEVGVENLPWTLKASDLTFEPKKFDRITDAVNIVWKIDSVTRATFGSRYKVETTRVPT